MRSGATFGFPRSGGQPKMLASPAVDFVKQKVDFKVRKAVGHSSEFERIELWSSDGGLIRRCKFDEPEPVKAPAEKPKEQIKKV